ncbi:MAG: hypothetical protein IJU62_08360 [Muribaculaceae bacterium]|nr:hypothetical protein [Muribaculaceae bacterium]
MIRRLCFAVAAVITALTAGAQATFCVNSGISDEALITRIENSVNDLMTSINVCYVKDKDKVQLSKELFSEGARNDVNEMWEGTGHMSVPDGDYAGPVIRLPKVGQHDAYEVRNIPVDFHRGDSIMRHELVLDVGTSGKVFAVKVAVEKHSFMELMANSGEVDDLAQRLRVINFVEQFRTAYIRKDLEFLESVYSDDALIITGRVLQHKVGGGMKDRMNIRGKTVLTRQTKQEYLKNLRGIFKRKDWLKIDFEDLEIVKDLRYDNLYGVTLKQYWQSPGYSDIGWLFLIIDMRDMARPQIYVRTWQPYKDTQNKGYNKEDIITTRDEVFELEDFRIELL